MKPKTQLEIELARLGADRLTREPPVDRKENHLLLGKIRLSRASESFESLVDTHFEQIRGGRNNAAAAALRRHLEYFFLCLSKCVMSHKYLVVSLTSNAYSKDYFLKKYNLKYAAVDAIVKYLEGAGLVFVIKGRKYRDDPMRTRIYPKPELSQGLFEYSLLTETDFDGDYVQFNDGADNDYGGDRLSSEKWNNLISNLGKDHPDRVDLNRINEFLEPHQWVSKGPVILKYKYSPFQSGRLYTGYQELLDKQYRIRINTEIDGDAISEVDFNANHLRLALAVLHDEDAGDSPYEDIMELANVDRALVKSFITVAMGASSRDKARSSWNDNRSSRIVRRADGDFLLIEAATNKRFPMLKLYDGWGIFAQNLEGAILRDVMLQGVDKGIVVLPVHDAVAVQQKHEDWAVVTMLEAWSRVAASSGAARARVKIDRP